MATPDLLAQKILGTDPRVGFGESFVLPPIGSSFDDTPYQHIGASLARAQKEREARAKNQMDLFGKIQRYDTKGKGNPEFQRQQAILATQMGQKIADGTLSTQDIIAYDNHLTQLKSLDEEDLRNYNANKEQVLKFGTDYNKRYKSGDALELNNKVYLQTPAFGTYSQYSDQLREGLNPKENPLLYNYSQSTEDFRDWWSSKVRDSYSNKTISEDEFEKFGSEITKDGIFMKRDANGNLVPGVSDNATTAYLEMDDGLVKNYIDKMDTEPTYLKDAQYIKRQLESDPTGQYASYAGLDEAGIYNKIIQSNPLQGGKSYAQYSFDKAKKDLERLNQYQVATASTTVKKEDKSYWGAGNPNSGVIAKPSVTNQNYNTPRGPYNYTDYGMGLYNSKGGTLKPIVVNPANMPMSLSQLHIKQGVNSFYFIPDQVGYAYYVADKDGTIVRATGKSTEGQKSIKSGNAEMLPLQRQILSMPANTEQEKQAKREAIERFFSTYTLMPFANGISQIKESDATLPIGMDVDKNKPQPTKQKFTDPEGNTYVGYTEAVSIPINEQNRETWDAIKNTYGLTDDAILQNMDTQGRELYDNNNKLREIQKTLY